MPRQHDPSDGETTPVAIRRAVAVPSPTADPGEALGPNRPGPTATAPDPAADPAAATAPGRTEGRRTGEQTGEQTAAVMVPEPEPEPDPAAATGTAGAGGGADGAGDSDVPPSGRPTKALLAGAAMVGAVLIAVPVLLAGADDDDKENTASQELASSEMLPKSEKFNRLPNPYTTKSPETRRKKHVKETPGD